MIITLSLLTLLVCLMTLLPVWRNPHWLVRGFDFPRLQLAVAALLLVMSQCWFFDLAKPAHLVMMGITIICALWQLIWILPYTFLWPKEVKSTRCAETSPAQVAITILTANVLMTNRQPEKLLAMVAQYQPDILLTLESDARWQEALDSVATDLPYAVKVPMDNLYGMHVYSRWPLQDAQTLFLVEDDVPSIHMTVVADNQQEFQLHCLHPAPPSPTENEASTERDAELIKVARMVTKNERPTIVTGDLNDVAWSSTTRLFRRMSGLLDPRIGRGMFNTFHAHIPLFRWPLDHLFHSAEFTLGSIKRLPDIGSDHFPLLSQLSYTPAVKPTQQGLEKTPQAEQRAAEIEQQAPHP